MVLDCVNCGLPIAFLGDAVQWVHMLDRGKTLHITSCHAACRVWNGEERLGLHSKVATPIRPDRNTVRELDDVIRDLGALL